MNTPQPLRSAEHYRAEAKRLRAEAEQMRNSGIRQQLLSVAVDYEGIADTVETIARQRGG